MLNTKQRNVKIERSLLFLNIKKSLSRNMTKILQLEINLSLFMCVLFHPLFVRISAYANVYF